VAQEELGKLKRDPRTWGRPDSSGSQVEGRRESGMLQALPRGLEAPEPVFRAGLEVVGSVERLRRRSLEEPTEGQEELAEVPVEAEEAPETQEAQAREAIRMPSPERVERSSSSVMESSMGRGEGPCPRGALPGQPQEASLVVGLEAGR